MARRKRRQQPKTLLSSDEEQRIIDAVNNQAIEDGFSVVKSFDEIREGKYSFNPGTYFDMVIEYVDINADEFSGKMKASKERLSEMFKQSADLELDIINGLEGLSLD